MLVSKRISCILSSTVRSKVTLRVKPVCGSHLILGLSIIRLSEVHFQWIVPLLTAEAPSYQA